MMVRNLWHGLHYSLPRHPLLWYGALKNRIPQAPRINEDLFFWIQALLYVGFWFAGFLGLAIWIVVGFPVIILVMLPSLVAGIATTVGVGMRIMLERERGRHELMGVTPSGFLGASWVQATHYFRTSSIATNFKQLIDGFHITWIFMLLALFFIVTLTMSSPRAAVSGEFRLFYGDLISPFNAGLLLLIARGDYLYSVVTGALVAMIVPTFARSRADGYVMMVIGFALVQLVSYLLFLLSLILVIEVAASVFVSLAGWIVSVLSFGTFFVVREMVLYLTCWTLARRLNTTVHEVVNVFRLSI